MKYVNICGIPEMEWRATMTCYGCGTNKPFCLIRPQDIIDERIYRYSEKHGLLIGSRFHAERLVEYVDHNKILKSIPKYVLEFVYSSPLK